MLMLMVLLMHPLHLWTAGDGTDFASLEKAADRRLCALVRDVSCVCDVRVLFAPFEPNALGPGLICSPLGTLFRYLLAAPVGQLLFAITMFP